MLLSVAVPVKPQLPSPMPPALFRLPLNSRDRRATWCEPSPSDRPKLSAAGLDGPNVRFWRMTYELLADSQPPVINGLAAYVCPMMKMGLAAVPVNPNVSPALYVPWSST